MVLADMAPWAALVAALFAFLWLDLHFFARGGDPSFRESAIWSVGWFVLGLLVSLVVWAFEGAHNAVQYTTVYLIERSLSLDNLFVFLLLFTYFGVPYVRRPRLLYWGIVGALVLRGGSSSAARPSCTSSTSSSTCSGRCCWCWPTGSTAGWRRTWTPTAT